MGNSFAKIVDLLNRVMAQDEEWGLDERFEVGACKLRVSSKLLLKR